MRLHSLNEHLVTFLRLLKESQLFEKHDIILEAGTCIGHYDE